MFLLILHTSFWVRKKDFQSTPIFAVSSGGEHISQPLQTLFGSILKCWDTLPIPEAGHVHHLISMLVPVLTLVCTKNREPLIRIFDGSGNSGL